MMSILPRFINESTSGCAFGSVGKEQENGIPIKGIVKAFDAYIVVVEDEKQQSIIYKHAISTIIPSVNPYSEAESN